MPSSCQPPEGKRLVLEEILSNSDRGVIDLGSGNGKWGKLLQGKVKYIDGIEIWKPYIIQYELDKYYRHIFNVNIMDFYLWNDYEIAILGDVLEHLTKKDAIILLQTINIHCEIFLTIPIIPIIQGSVFGNIYETHLEQWNHESLDQLGFMQLHFFKPLKVGTYHLRKQSLCLP